MGQLRRRRGNAVPEHLESPEARPEGPKPERVRSRPGVLRFGCWPFRTSDRRSHHPPPPPSRQKPRTRVDYFQRTITKAARRIQGIDPFAAPLGTPGAPAPAPPAPPGSPQTGPSGEQGASGAPENGQPKQNATLDPARARAKLCEKVSQVLGIRVVRLIWRKERSSFLPWRSSF